MSMISCRTYDFDICTSARPYKYLPTFNRFPSGMCVLTVEALLFVTICIATTSLIRNSINKHVSQIYRFSWDRLRQKH